MYVISKEFTFSAAHQLRGLPDDHPCSRLHGHNYTVVFVLEAVHLDNIGFVTDYRQLDTIKVWLDQTWDHRNLNDLMTENPTAEWIAFVLYLRFASEFTSLRAVRVSETPKTWAEYKP